MEKKNSIFAGITRVPEPSPGATPVSRPAGPDPEVSILKMKIEAMEKKIAEAAIPAASEVAPKGASKPPDTGAQFLLARLGEMDRRLEEFTRTAMVSSSQMKNIEESKISARREIEDLLKVVREQQKYSELDHQMHEQLEKSWRRVEELEKKLMDFYGAVLAGQQKKEEIDGMLSRDLGGKIEALAERFERYTQAIERKFQAQETFLAAAPDLKKELKAELGQQAADFKSMFEVELKSWSESMRGSIAAELKKEIVDSLNRTREEALFIGREQASSFKTILEELIKARFDEVQGSLNAEFGRSRLAANMEMDGFKKEFAGPISGIRKTLEDFGRTARENLDAVSNAAGSVTKNTTESAEIVKNSSEKMIEFLGRDGGKFLSDLEERNRRSYEALNTKYADALSNASILEIVEVLTAASLKKVLDLEATISGFIKQADKDRLVSAPGVSGMLTRRSIEAQEALLAEIRQDAAGLERVKQKIRSKLTNVFREESK